MRKEMTIAERTLWKSLKGNQLGVKFRRQHPIGPYIVDFYSWEAGLVVEVDGDSHFSNESLNYDRERTQHLETLGLTVIPFTNAEIRQHLPEALEEIWRISTALKPSEIHCREWRRADSLRPADVVFVAESLNPFSFPGQRAVPAVSASQRMHSFQSSCGQICLPERHGEPIYPPLSPRQRGEANSTLTVDGEDKGAVLLMRREIVSLETVDTSGTVFNVEVEDSQSVITEVCAVRTSSTDISSERSDQRNAGRRTSSQ